MKRFDLMKSTREIMFKERFEIKEGCTFDQNNMYPIIIKVFETKKDALDMLKSYKTDIRELNCSAGTYFEVNEYYVEENEYDDDGEFVKSDGVLEFSSIEIELVEKPGYNTIGVFYNYEDVENAYKDYDGENEIYISL